MNIFWAVLCLLAAVAVAPGIGSEKSGSTAMFVFVMCVGLGLWNIYRWRASKKARAAYADASRVADEAAALVLADIEAGRLPVVAAPQVLTRGAEVVRYEVESTMVEWTKRRATIKSGSVRFRLTDRITIGGARGAIQADDEPVVAGRGVLSITSNRLVFTGAPKSYEIPLTKITAMEALSDGVAINALGKMRLFTVPGKSSSSVVDALIRAGR